MYSSAAVVSNFDSVPNSTSRIKKESHMFNSMKELREANKKLGHLFFDRKSMKLWNLKIETPLYRGTFFITSQKGNAAKDKRKFKINQAAPNGAISTAGNVGGYGTLDDAKDAVKALIRNLRVIKPLKKAQ